MNIFAFAASNHKASMNKRFLSFALDILKTEFAPDANIDQVDLLAYELPLYRQDREADNGIPEAAQDFFARIGAADAIIASFPEHNGGYSAVYKNLFDWMSRIDAKAYQGTPMLAMAASPGPRGGAGVLGAIEATAPYFGMDLRGTVSLPTFFAKFDSESGVVTDAAIVADVKAKIALLLGEATA